MRIADMLYAIASWLESPDNEALLLSEYHDDSMKIVSENCVLAAALLKNAAEQVNDIEPPEESKITPESLAELANLATAFDYSGDPGLKKQASVLDELLLSVAAPPNAYAERKDLYEQRILDLNKKYKDTGKELSTLNKVSDSEKAIEKSKMTKTEDMNVFGLSSRYCPDHPGTPTARVGEHMVRCSLDRRIYNYETGFTLSNGVKVPGGDVSLQTANLDMPSHAIFDSREDRLGYNR